MVLLFTEGSRNCSRNISLVKKVLNLGQGPWFSHFYLKHNAQVGMQGRLNFLIPWSPCLEPSIYKVYSQNPYLEPSMYKMWAERPGGAGRAGGNYSLSTWPLKAGLQTSSGQETESNRSDKQAHPYPRPRPRCFGLAGLWEEASRVRASGA